MVFEEFAVRCETIKQRNEVIIVLEGIGYKNQIQKAMMMNWLLGVTKMVNTWLLLTHVF